ncbi:glycosyltransferase [Rhodoferax sp.]|uniref:glycosyltransferase n=1 Tax=Rhodoferax sp. TaxID=50421 RepID=UPI0025E273DB|nr:glycosyltransferase [Rhodoferax sp.]
MARDTRPNLSISIVSHGQMALVLPLLRDLDRLHLQTPLEVILTLNIPEDMPCTADDFGFSLRVVRNLLPMGFGANHNQALAQARCATVCILNPDIRLTQNPFPGLLAVLEDPLVGLVAPAIYSPAGQLEDSARRFPTPWGITAKAILRKRQLSRASTHPETVFYPDWVGGMFMVLSTALYRSMGGFDEKFFLYYEDVDLCARIRLQSLQIALLPHHGVTHDAQRSSHTQRKYLRWHLSSMLRFFCSRVFIRALWLHRP